MPHHHVVVEQGENVFEPKERAPVAAHASRAVGEHTHGVVNGERAARTQHLEPELPSQLVVVRGQGSRLLGKLAVAVAQRAIDRLRVVAAHLQQQHARLVPLCLCADAERVLLVVDVVSGQELVEHSVGGRLDVRGVSACEGK